MDFFNEDLFENTPIGRIPKDWEKQRLDAISEVIDPWPSHRAPRIVPDGYPYVGIGDIKQDGEILFKQCRKVSEQVIIEQEKILNEPESIAIGKVGTVGKVVWVKKQPFRFALSATLVLLKPNERVSKNYLYYILQSEAIEKQLEKLTTGSTRPNVGILKMRLIEVPLPSLPEQKAIAEVLDVVDSASKYSDCIIAKTERLKRGLMQQLLNSGIGHTEHKQTTIGVIPKEWRLVELRDILSVSSGQYFKFSEFTNEGIRCLKIDNVGFGEVVWDGTTFLPKTYLQTYPELVLKAGDLVLALNRPIIGDKVKVGMITAKDTPSLLYQRVGKIILKDSSQVDNKFLLSIFTSDGFKNQLRQSLVGTDQPYIRLSLFLKIKMPFPSMNEQQKIIEILSNITRKLWLEQEERDRLEKIKQGLMDLLLTGKVRIKVD